MMEKIKQFIKNKGIGYYVAAATALCALILAIIFFATFSNPALDPITHHSPMGNKADGMLPETIGIFLLAGVLVEVVVLVLPQYRFIHIITILLYGLALYKEVIIIPDFLAGKANNVMYNGGNYDLNMFYLISLILIAVAAIVAAFLGFYKSDEEAKKEMAVKGTAGIIKVSAAAVVVIAAVLSSTLVSTSLSNKVSQGKANGGEISSSSKAPAKPRFNPINDEIKAKADAIEYDFDPSSIKMEEQEEWDYSDSRLSGLTYTNTRAGHNLVYVFEGEYSEGYQGQYNTYTSGMYLWDDGVFAGKSNSQNFKGFWYNSSLTAPEDDPLTEDVDESIDCLNMVSNDEFTISDQGDTRTDKFFASIITEPPMGGTSDFYERQAYIFMYPGWGKGRSVVVSGYKYYPDCAAVIDTNGYDEMKVGEKFIINSTWFFDKIIKNLNFTQIIPSSEIQWTIPNGMIDEKKKLVAAGEYEITAKWKTYEATATLKVTE